MQINTVNDNCSHNMEERNSYRNKTRGMLVGLAIGDALGAPVEFGYSSRKICALDDKINSFQNSINLPAGAWTDDTSMALCLADSLLEKHGYDSYDIMNKFRKWATYGYRSFDGNPAFDIGTQTSNAINRFIKQPVIRRDEPKTFSAGNGAIMRLAPIIIANTFLDKKYPTIREKRGYPDDGEWIELDNITPTLEMARLSCRETHNSVAAEAITEMFATTLYCALHGINKTNIAAYCSRWIRNEELSNFCLSSNDSLARIFYKEGNSLKDLGGYICDCFTIALWGLYNFGNFKDGMLAVIRLGGDTDTNAACYGQLAGAYYGYNSIPEEWRKNVLLADEIIQIADNLLDMKECPVIRTRFEDDKNFQSC